MIGRHWRDSDLRDARAFRQAMLRLVAQATIAYRQNNRIELQSITRALKAAKPYCLHEPMLSVYEHGFCMISLLACLSFVGTGQHEEVYSIAGGINELLKAGDRRRLRAGLARRDMGEIRFTLLNVLGDCKWQGSNEDRNRIMSPEEMCEEWPRVYHRTMANAYTRHADDPARIDDLHTALGWAGLQVIKTANRFTPARVIGLVKTFNQWYGPTLAMSVGHYRKGKMLAPDSPLAWDWELCKLYCAGELTQRDLDEIHIRREAALRIFLAGEDYDLSAYRVAAEREYVMLKNGIKIEVVHGAA